MGMVFARPSDDLIASATVTLASGSALSGYGLTKLNNGVWADPLMISETEIDIRFDFGSATAIDWAILGNTNLTVAAKLQGHTSNSFGTPDVDLTFGIPVMNARGTFSSPHVDASATAAKRYWRLYATGNTYPIIIGELGLLAARRTITHGVTYASIGLSRGGRSIVHQTPFGVDLAYELHAAREMVSGQIFAGSADLAALEGLVDSARFQARPFWMIPRSDETDAWFVRFAADDVTKTPVGPAAYWVDFPVRQLSRGLPWVAA